jgi:hypothetical protein
MTDPTLPARIRWAISIRHASDDLGHRISRFSYRLGWWTHLAGKGVAWVLTQPERRKARP